MCGRYTQTLKADDLADAMAARDETGGEVRERYNVAPTTTQPIVTADRPAPGEPSTGRLLRMARWGLVPSWAKDVSIGSRMINARSETIADKPAFRKAFATRRCLVPVTGFYEWYRPDGKKRGQPYFIHRGPHPGVGPGGELLAFAGLFEVWRGGGRDGAGEAVDPLTSYTILTTGPAVGLEFLHDRSPVVLPAAHWARWLDPSYQDIEALRALLAPAPAGVLETYPVGPEVGDVRNQGPHLVERFELPPGTPDPQAAAVTPAPEVGLTEPPAEGHGGPTDQSVTLSSLFGEAR
jgi:putative SOS response-associated peptidase YedK